MNRAGWWLASTASRMLEPGEREVIRGDFAELGTGGGKALREVLGLVARRQLALWKDWRPWLAFVGLAIPVGLVLTLSSRSLHGAYDLYLFIARNYRAIDPALLRQTGLTLLPGITQLACASFLVVARAWISGFTLGSLSRRTIWVNGTVFYAVVVWMELAPTPLRGRDLYLHYGFSSAILSLGFAVALPIVLLVLPSFWGMRRGLQPGPLSLVQALAWATALADTVMLVALAHRALWPPLILWYVVGDWPVVYILVTAGAARRRNKSLSC